jgi:hypothetical protein
MDMFDHVRSSYIMDCKVALAFLTCPISNHASKHLYHGTSRIVRDSGL